MSSSVVSKLKVVFNGIIYLFIFNFGVLGLFNVVEVRSLALCYSLFGGF